MPTVFVKGDMFRYAGLRALAHGCNCAGAMGKGIALEFRARFPAMYAEYRRRCLAGEFPLGEVFMWTESDGTIVFNLGTQVSWKTKADISAIEASTGKMLQLAELNNVTTVGLPRIGAGLGGLPWQQVRALLERMGQTTSVELVVFEEFVS